MSTKIIAQLKIEIFSLQLQLKETDLELKRFKLEYSSMLINIGGETVCPLQIEDELFWDKWYPTDDNCQSCKYQHYKFAQDIMRQEYPHLWKYEGVIQQLRRLPEECMSLCLEIDEKKAELKKLKDKENIFSWLIQLANTMF